ncbi:hypothetical protein HGRIS_009621 [Hohenbuehelia grisea]|uniref:Carbohydrate kinase PfkB domain-containing protein n=1 Tax=Hohenbuehelia grisea TaxID=104357 RepID=A0ABR3J1X6_9AGAR
MVQTSSGPHFVTLGMFIVDEFAFADEDGRPTGKIAAPQIGGGGTYAAIGARIWLQPQQIGMIVDRGHDFPQNIQESLDHFGPEMWHFRDQTCGTTRALNSYKGDHRDFEYLTPRIRITPKDLDGTRIARPTTLHFICSPTRALSIISEVEEIEGWNPRMIYEPIPYRCVPDELPSLVKAMSSIFVLSPNAEEALALLSVSEEPSIENIERAAQRFIDIGVGKAGDGFVIIRSGPLGAYVLSRAKGGQWIEAYWTDAQKDKVVDVTGAGNSFLGGLAAGLRFTSDVYEGMFFPYISLTMLLNVRI